jgi:hypothetical protein
MATTQLTIELPKETPSEHVAALQADLKQLSDVKGSGVYTPRGVGPEDIMVWVKVAGAIAPLVPLLVDMLRKRRIERVTISLPNGTRIEVDKATAMEIEQLVAASQANASHGGTAP